MNFILIVGPPAVGKMTVSQQLAKKLDYKPLFNHHSIELALNFFVWGDPEFKSINEGIRQLIFKTVSESKKLKGFIFTLVWAFDMQEDWDYVATLKNRFIEQGWQFYIVELHAPLSVRLERNKTHNRLANKASKRNLEASQKNLLELEKGYQMTSQMGSINEEHYIRLDNSELSADDTADLIIEQFQLDINP